MSDARKDHWEGIYGAKDDNSLSWFQQVAEPSIELFRRHAPSRTACIADVGSGTSFLVDQLLKEGFSNITLVDISQSALDRTAERLGERGTGVKFLQADATTWQPDIKADIWHDRAVFHFLTEKFERDAYLTALLSATRTDSIVIMGTFARDAPEKCSGLLVQRYSADQLEALLADSFELLESLRHVHITPAGIRQPFTFAVFRRR